MIRLDASQTAEIVDFLTGHAPTQMFALTNLARHGMAGGHPRALKIWAARNGGAITDILSMSEEGMVFPCCPSGDWGAVREVLAGRMVKGVIGGTDQVAALRAATGLTHAARMDEDEPGYTLDLADLKVPDPGPCTLHPLGLAPRETLIAWRAAYIHETLFTPADEAVEQAERDVQFYLSNDDYRVLCRDGTPVAMTGFNATAAGIVQIGGVYTPPVLRSGGLGRLAVALHLAEAAAQQGITQAVLSAANPAAERAYRGIGFVPSGRFTLAIWAVAHQVQHG